MAEDTSASGAESDQAELETQSVETEAEGQRPEAKQVSHQTYKKLVGEAKRERESRRAIEAELKELRDQRLAEQGNKDELIKSLRAKLDGETKKTKEIYGSFARKSVSQQIKSAALEAGAIDAETVLSLADFSQFDIDPDTFEANADDVKDMITALKKSKGFLFQKAGPNVNGKLPNGAKVGSVKAEDFSRMKPDQIQAWLKANEHLLK